MPEPEQPTSAAEGSQVPSAHLAVFPYLWMRKRTSVGPYELIPKAAVAESDFAERWLEEPTAGLLKMYELRGSMGNRFGTLVRRRDGKIGDEFDRQDMRPLRRAVMTALLDRNPSRIGLVADVEGWSVSTSDHALFFVHQLDGTGHVAVQYGRMVEVLVGGITIGEERHSCADGDSHVLSRARP